MFNITQIIIDQLKAFVQGILIDNLPLVESTGLGYLEATKTRLTTLLHNAPELSREDIQRAILDEKDVFISELKSFEEIGLSFTQETINNAGQVVMSILNANLPTK